MPTDMMTLDGTLWEEDGIPYMVYCHEWVQVTNGGVGYVQLKADLSDTAGEPTHDARRRDIIDVCRESCTVSRASF